MGPLPLKPITTFFIAVALPTYGCNAIFGLDEVQPLAGAGGAGGASNTGNTGAGGSSSSAGGDGGGGNVGAIGTCDSPLTLTLPTDSNVTLDGAPESVDDGCGTAGEIVYQLVAPVSQTLFLQATPQGGTDVSMSFRTECGVADDIPPCCEAGNQTGCSGPMNMEACVCNFDQDCCNINWSQSCVNIIEHACNGTLCQRRQCANFTAAGMPEQIISGVTAGETYYIHVHATTPVDTGSVQLVAQALDTGCVDDANCTDGLESCQRVGALFNACLPDGSCSNTIGLQPGSQETSDANSGNSFHTASCRPFGASTPGYAAAPEVVYQYAGDGKNVELTITSQSNEQLYVYVREATCGNASAEIACELIPANGQPQVVAFNAQLGVPYYIFVDTADFTFDAATFQIELTEL